MLHAVFILMTSCIGSLKAKALRLPFYFRLENTLAIW